jgi:hypothetical protein
MKTSSLNVGFCYDAQLVDSVLVDQWGVFFLDITLDFDFFEGLGFWILGEWNLT